MIATFNDQLAEMTGQSRRDTARITTIVRIITLRKQVEILAALCIGPKGVTELAELLGYATPDVSMQLRKLRAHGLVVEDRQGKRRIQHVVKEPSVALNGNGTSHEPASPGRRQRTGTKPRRPLGRPTRMDQLCEVTVSSRETLRGTHVYLEDWTLHVGTTVSRVRVNLCWPLDQFQVTRLNEGREKRSRQRGGERADSLSR